MSQSTNTSQNPLSGLSPTVSKLEASNFSSTLFKFCHLFYIFLISTAIQKTEQNHQNHTSLSVLSCFPFNLKHITLSMALARLALKNFHQKLSFSPSTTSAAVQKQRYWANNEFVKRFATAGSDKVSDEKSECKQVSVTEGNKKSNKLFPRRQRRRGLWRNTDRNFLPSLYGNYCLYLP